VAAEDGPQAGLEFLSGLKGLDLPVMGSDLNATSRMDLEVLPPLGVARVAPVGGHHNQVVSIGQVKKRRGKEPSAAPSPGGQQQVGHSRNQASYCAAAQSV